MAGFFTAMDNGYKRILAGAIRFRYITVLVVLAIFGGSLALIPSAGFEFVPTQGEDSVILDVQMPIGTRLDVTRNVLKQMELIVQDEIQGYERIIVEVGEPSFFGFLGSSNTSKGSITITLPPFEQRIDDSETIQQKMRRHFNDFPSAVFEFGAAMGGGGLGGSPIVVKLRSEDRELMRVTGERIVELLEERVPEATEPQVNSSEGLPQVEIVIDRAKAYELGLNIATIGQEVRANIDGISAGMFRTGGSEFDILVILEERNRDQIPDLQKIFVNNSFGSRIPLSSFASLERSTGPVSINREDQSRSLQVTAGLAPGNTINVVMPEIQKLIAQVCSPNDKAKGGYSKSCSASI